MFTPLDDSHPVAQNLNREQTVTMLARELMSQHGLHDWTFRISRAIRTLGTCDHSTKMIEYSSHYLDQPWSEITDTILHEIAHALIPAKHGHDSVWKAKCREIGARPVRCATHITADPVKPKFYLQCPGCKRKWYRHRIKRKLIGARSRCCGQPLRAFKIKGR